MRARPPEDGCGHSRDAGGTSVPSQAVTRLPPLSFGVRRPFCHSRAYRCVVAIVDTMIRGGGDRALAGQRDDRGASQTTMVRRTG